jgi:hypothetical protein
MTYAFVLELNHLRYDVTAWWKQETAPVVQVSWETAYAWLALKKIEAAGNMP